jgi:hypothetical protein
MDFIQNRTMKPLAIALSGVERGSKWRDSGGDLNNVQYKPSQYFLYSKIGFECHYLKKSCDVM